MGRPKKIPKGLEAHVLRLVNRPPIVDGRLLNSQLRVNWRRIEQVPSEVWMKWPLGPSFGQLTNVPTEQIETWTKSFPRHPDWHFRGIISEDCAWLQFRKCLPDHFLPLVEKNHSQPKRFDAAFHSQPVRSIYSDIPLREDVYRFIKLNLRIFFAIGKSKACLLVQDEEASNVHKRLLNWEAEHPYSVSRLISRRSTTRTGFRLSREEVFRTYTYAALRGIGLAWPAKPFARRAAWHQALQSIGLKVQVYDTAQTLSNST